MTNQTADLLLDIYEQALRLNQSYEQLQAHRNAPKTIQEASRVKALEKNAQTDFNFQGKRLAELINEAVEADVPEDSIRKLFDKYLNKHIEVGIK